MFRSERMKRVNVLVLERDVDRLVMGLGSLATIHLTPPTRQGEGSLLVRPDRREDIERLKNLERRIERVGAVLKVRLDTAEPVRPHPGMDRTE